MTEKKRCIHSGLCRYSKDEDGDCFGDEYQLQCDSYTSASQRDEVLDELIDYYKQVIVDGKGTVYYHPINYQWIYGGVVDYLEKLKGNPSKSVKKEEKILSKFVHWCNMFDDYTCGESFKPSLVLKKIDMLMKGEP